jgi:hypothetical protein
VEEGKNLQTLMVRQQLISFSKRIGTFLFRTFGGFLHVPTTQIYYLIGAKISDTHITNVYLKLRIDPPQYLTKRKGVRIISIQYLSREVSQQPGGRRKRDQRRNCERRWKPGQKGCLLIPPPQFTFKGR